MGICYGTIFGYMDVEDSADYRLRINLLKEEMYCYPIGILIGGLAGAINEILR